MSNYIGSDPSQLINRLKARYFYGLKRTDKGELYIKKVDQSKTSDEVIINNPGPSDEDYTNFVEGTNFLEGRSVDHTILFDNLNYEQYRWDNKNIFYYVDEEGRLSARGNKPFVYDDTIASPGLNLYEVEIPGPEPVAVPVVQPPPEVEEPEADPTYTIVAQQTVNEGQDINAVLNTTDINSGTALPYTITGVDINDITSIRAQYTVAVATNAQPPGNSVFTINATQYPNLTLARNHTYIFNQNDVSNATVSNPLAFSTTPNGTHAGGSIYEEGIVYKLDGLVQADAAAYAAGFALASSRTIEITPTDTTPIRLYYFGINTANMNPTGEVSIIGTTLLDGVFNVFNSVGVDIIRISEDLVTEGSETLTISLANGGASGSITINDTSQDPVSTYELVASEDAIDEGGTVQFTLNTTNVPENANINYTITGVEADDISVPLTGTLTVQADTAFLNIRAEEDQNTEGTQTLTLALNNGQASASVTINDTSLTPPPTYALEASAALLDEGDNVFITLTTTSVENGTDVPYTITGISQNDLATGSITGNFLVVDNTSTIAFAISADNTTEGNENFVLSLDGTDESITIPITDTSTNPVVPATYDLTADVTEINEGETATITLNTTELSNGSTVAYTITGVAVGDISLDSLTGNFTITDDTATLEIGLLEDNTTEGVETLTLSLNNGEGSVEIAIADTSQTPVNSTYLLTPSQTAINEGDTLTITLDTTFVPNGTVFGYTVSGVNAEDISSGNLIGSFTVLNNTAATSFTFRNDLATEGNETFSLTLDNGQDTVQVTINDSSQAPAATYSLSSTADNVNEGSSVTITLNTTNVPDGTDVAYSISGIDASDLSSGSMSGNFSLTSGVAQQAFTFSEDLSTEGSENFVLSLDNGEDSITVIVNDTSESPPADYTLNVTNDGASNYTFSGSDRSGAVSGNDVTLAFNTGDVVDFVVNAPGHPFYVKTANSTGSANQANGVTNNGAQTGTVRWSVPVEYAGQQLHYNCEFHAAMHGLINIT